MLTHAATLDEFLGVWRWGSWNDFTIRIVGEKPVVTCWINDLEIAELDMAALVAPHADADAVANLLGPRRHIAFEVHDNDSRFGDQRWGRHAACRWRNIRIREL